MTFSPTAMTRRFIFMLILTAAAGVSVGCNAKFARNGAPPAGPHFSVMTYNVHYFMRQPDETARAIAETDADIVCLQETNADWRRYLSGRLTRQYPHRRFRHYGRAGGLAILSKTPFREVAYTQPKPPYFPSWVVEADTPLGPVHICNIHLKAPLNKNGHASLVEYLKNPVTHARELSEVYDNLAADRPRLVIGDFNEDDHGGGIRWLADRGFQDALSKFDRSTETWRWTCGLLTFRDRLDHIMYSKGLRCVSAWVVDKGKSDHFPVVAIIERDGQAAKP